MTARSRPKSLVLMDLNMTLLDDGKELYDASRNIFKAYGREPPGLTQFLRELNEHDGDPWPIYVSRGMPADNEKEKSRMFSIFKMEYGRSMSGIKLSPGAADAIQLLLRRNTILGIITRQKKELSIPLLKILGVIRYFRYIFTEHPDKGGIIPLILLKEMLAPSRCLYITDMPYEISDVKSTGVHAIGYYNGHMARELMEAAEPHNIISHFDQLPPLAERMLR